MTFNRSRNGWPVGRTHSSGTIDSRPTALATAVQSVLLGLGLGTTVLPGLAVGQVTTPSAEESVKSFSVPAGPLDEALNRFARTAGVNVSYDAALVAARTSKGLSGSYRVASGLTMLLADTGVEAVAQPGGGYSLRSAPRVSSTLPVVRAVADALVQENLLPSYAGGQLARGGQLGLLGNKDFMDTPFNQTSYTQQTIQDQQARTLQDVFANDPSVIPLMTHGTDFTATYFRGFVSQIDGNNSDFSLNGLFGLVPGGTPPLAAVERVELLKGPSALLNGMSPSGATGGTANLVTKRATDEPVTELTASYVSRSQFGPQVDVGRRFGGNKQFGVRFNGTYRNGDATVDEQEEEQVLGALNLDYRGERIRLSVDVGRSADDVNAAPMPIYMGNVTTVPSAPDAGKSFVPSWAHYENSSTYGMAQAGVDLTEHVTAYVAAGLMQFEQERNTATPSLTNTDGDTRFRARIQRTSTDADAEQAGVRAIAVTGPIDHELNFIASRTHQESGFAQGPNVFLDSNLYVPTFGSRPGYVDPGDARKNNEVTLTSYGVADTLSILDRRIQLTLGVRRQRVESINFDTATGAEAGPSYDASETTPAFTLVVKPTENVSIYGNYIEGLEQGIVVGPDFENQGQVFPPYVSEQYEAGVKVDWGTLATTLSAFEISRASTIQTAGTPLPTLRVDGEQVNRGIEINVFGELAPGWRVLGGATFMDAELSKTQDGARDGNKAMGVADARYVFGSEYDVPFLGGLTLTGRVTRSGEVHASNTIETLVLPSWTRVDLGARYTLAAPWASEPITVRFGVENLLDKNYWSSGFFEYVSLSAPRTYLLSATFGF